MVKEEIVLKKIEKLFEKIEKSKLLKEVIVNC